MLTLHLMYRIGFRIKEFILFLHHPARGLDFFHFKYACNLIFKNTIENTALLVSAFFNSEKSLTWSKLN